MVYRIDFCDFAKQSGPPTNVLGPPVCYTWRWPCFHVTDCLVDNQFQAHILSLILQEIVCDKITPNLT